MSLRPEFYGFSLRILRSLLGSRDSKVLEAVSTVARKQIDGDAGPVLQILEQAIIHGAPFPNLDAENEDQCTEMMLLASHEQTLTQTDSFRYRAVLLSDLWDAIESKLPPDAGRLFHGLVDGRAMLGHRIWSEWSYYAWLSREELGQVRRAPEVVARETSNPVGDGFLRDLLGWLHAIEAKEQDLWYFAF